MARKKVIDSHVHFFAESHLSNRVIPWAGKIAHDHRLDEYLQVATSSNHELVGAVFLETDVRQNLVDQGWEFPIEEYLFVERTILGKQFQGEGSAKGSGFIRAIVPWIPLPQGPEKVEEYVEMMRSKSQDPETFQLVKGFRFLLQGKERGTMLQPQFMQSLNWLASKGFVFDLGLDIRSDGIWQLEEFVQLMKQTKNVRYILNHLSKPVLTLPPESLEDSQVFKRWKALMSEVSKDTNNDYYIKLSGGFSELPADIVNLDAPDQAISRIKPWLSTFTQLFPSDRFIFGSDWPVCSIQMKSPETTWEKWAIITDSLLETFGLGDEIYYENILKAYNIEE